MLPAIITHYLRSTASLRLPIFFSWCSHYGVRGKYLNTIIPAPFPLNWNGVLFFCRLHRLMRVLSASSLRAFTLLCDNLSRQFLRKIFTRFPRCFSARLSSNLKRILSLFVFSCVKPFCVSFDRFGVISCMRLLA